MKEVSIRHLRIEERLLEELETIVPLELQDPRLINSQVTRVHLAADLKSCRVYIIDRGEADEREEVLRALNHAAPHIRSEVAGSLGLKFTPRFQFYYDDSTERALRVEQIIDNLHVASGEDAPGRPEEETNHE
jgi:ribosome-binding factor A